MYFITHDFIIYNLNQHIFSQNVKGLLSPFWTSLTLVTQNQPFGIGNGNSCFGIIVHPILVVKIS